jgi:Tol biopolymer transport system component
MVRQFAFIIFILCILFQSIAIAQNKILPANKIAFLRNHSIWLAKTDGSAEQRITSKSIKIDHFLFSPSLRYLAYSKIVGSTKDRSICSIVIFDLKTNKNVKQTDSEYVYLLKWLPQDKLLYYNSDEYAIGDLFIYNPIIDTVIKNNDEHLSEVDFSRDEQLEAYAVSYDGNLHLHRHGAGRDTVIQTGKHPIYDVRISHNKKYISFVQVLDINNRDI